MEIVEIKREDLQSALQDLKWRVGALSTIVSGFPKEMRTEDVMLPDYPGDQKNRIIIGKMCLVSHTDSYSPEDILRALEDLAWRVDVLTRLAEHLPDILFSGVLDASPHPDREVSFLPWPMIGKVCISK